MIPLNMTIDPDFFEEEERCGYKVSRLRKEIWAVELDLLQEFDRVCKKHGLTYCAGAGTMLGAVRHQGFIPWDDDVDLYMIREDYNKLMSLADEFSDPYFLQTPYTEEHLIRTFCRLRNAHTTGTNRREKDMPICKGLFIDIFPLDGVSPDKGKDKRQYCLNKFQRNVCGCYNYTQIPKDLRSGDGLKGILYRAVAAVFVRDRIKTYQRVEKNFSKYSRPDTRMWGNRTLFFKCPKSRRPKEDYLDLISMPFEMIEIPVPKKYDELLRQQYGDYMQIPENKDGSIHGELIVSTDHSYDDTRRK